MGCVSSRSPPLHAPADSLSPLLAGCETAATRLSNRFPALTSLTADLVARNHRSVPLGQVNSFHSFHSVLRLHKTQVLGHAKRLFCKLQKMFEAALETVDVSRKQLRVWAAVAGAGAVNPDLISYCALAPSPLLASPRLLQSPVLVVISDSSLLFAGVLGSVVNSDGLRVVSAAGPGLKWFEPHSSNEFSVVLAQGDGSVPVWLTSDDVVLDVIIPGGIYATASAGSNATAVRSELMGQQGQVGTVSVGYGGLSESALEVGLQLTVCGVAVGDIIAGDSDWCVRVPRKQLAGHECAALGMHTRTLAVEKGRTFGMAVSADEKWLVVGLRDKNTLFVYSLPEGALVRSFGGNGHGLVQFNGLSRLCFAPNGNLVVVDRFNKPLQEVTLEGVFVRFIGVGDFDDGTAWPNCVTVHDDVIAVGCGGGTGPRVMLFDFGTGAVTSRFGENGTAAGQLSNYCTGIQFTPDGRRVIVAEAEAMRISLFTTAGVFDRCVGVGVLGRGVKDTVQSLTGEYVVADYVNHRVCVFSPDGSELVRSWGVRGTGEGQFQFPTVFATAGEHLYVMENSSGRVQVFK